MDLQAPVGLQAILSKNVFNLSNFSQTELQTNRMVDASDRTQKSTLLFPFAAGMPLC